jgi:hypothetical protein
MKTILLISFIFIFLSIDCFSYDYEYDDSLKNVSTVNVIGRKQIIDNKQEKKFEFIFLGDNYILYKGAQLKIRQDAISGFDHSFYSNLKYFNSMYDNNVVYPSDEYEFVTEKDSLMNKIFLVSDIVDKNGKSLIGNEYIPYLDNPIFVLIDTFYNQTLYFKYEKNYDFNFPFDSFGINYSKDILSSDIEIRKDDFTNEVKINTPILSGNQISPMIIHKIIKGSTSSYYLSLRTIGYDVNVNKSGVIILFEDGSKWSRQSKVDVEVADDGFEYTSYIRLTNNDLSIFSSKRVKKFRLYIYDQSVNIGIAEKFKVYASCIKDLK